MKLFFVFLLALFFAAYAVPSKEAVHGQRAYSIENDLANDRFVGKIDEPSFGPPDGFDLDREIEVVSEDEHSYKDFSGEARYGDYDEFHKFEGYEDVIPEEVRVSGQSVETEDINNNTRELSNDQVTSPGGENEELEGELDVAEDGVEDVTVKGQSEYSYLVGDKLHGLNDMKAVGAMNGAEKVLFDTDHHERFGAPDHDVETQDEASYRASREEVETEDSNYGYQQGYGDMDDLTVKGQAIEHEADSDEEDMDYGEDEDLVDAERYGGEEWDEDDDEEYDDDGEIDHGVRSAELDGEEDYDDEFEDDDDEDYTVRDEEEENAEDMHLKGMSMKDERHGDDAEYEGEEDDDVLDEELMDGMEEVERQDDDFDDEDDDNEYVDDAERFEEGEFDDEEDDEDVDEDDDDLAAALRDVDATSVDADVGTEAESNDVHGDDIEGEVRAADGVDSK